MDVRKIINSKEYKNAKTRISKWKLQLSDAKSKDEINQIKDEKTLFFNEMKKNHPITYGALRINDKELSESIYERLTGKQIIID